MDKAVENTIDDLVSDFLYYDRKEDEDLPLGVIDRQIKEGSLSVDEIVHKFKEELEYGLSQMSS